MPNDLATLRARLETQLSDATNAAWSQAEKEDLIRDAVQNLYPHNARPFVAPIWPLTANKENYNAPTGMLEVHRVELGAVATDLLLRVLDTGTWYTYDDALTGSLKLFINKRYSDPAYYYIVHGVGRYDLTTVGNYIPDHLIPLVLASARLEAYRRSVGEAARFEQWQNADPTQMGSVNQLLSLVENAERDLMRLRATIGRTNRRPVPARLSN